MLPKPRVYTIPYHVPFLSELVAFLTREYGDDSQLSKAKIILPSRRATRELQFEFLKSSPKTSLLMPKFMPIGDVDDEELDLSLLSLTDGLSSALDLPPIISSIDRRFILAELIAQKDKNFSWAQCLDFAKALSRLMDQIYTENLNLSDLPSLVPANDLSDHWKDIVQFLDILSIAWPSILNERGQIDAADRRNRLMRLLADYWRDHPPQTPVMIAGSTGSIPVVTDLMKVISHLPQGAVILPGLDLNIPDDVWNTLPLSHPQSIMKNTIHVIGIPRDQVQILNSKHQLSKTEIAVREMMYPSPYFLTSQSQVSEQDISHIHIAETSNEREEALSIALILRRMMNDPQKTAIVITPDRNLARRISSELKRWNIMVNDSAGQGLHTQNIAIFMKKLMGLYADPIDIPAFLTFLKLPYFQDILSQDDIFDFENKFYRSAKIIPQNISLKSVSEIKDDYPFLEKFFSLFQSIEQVKDQELFVSEFLNIILTSVSSIISDPSFIWADDDGESMLSYLQNLQSSDVAARRVTISEFRDIVEHFWSETMVRSTTATHPNITILGQIEARLLKPDVVILAGLNEGVWPQDPTPDPWMSVHMRQKFGLPPVERQYALSAHDFLSGLSSNEVYITRSIKLNGTPTVPARWLQRLMAYLEYKNIDIKILTNNFEKNILPIIQNMIHVDSINKIEEPLPRPPAHIRPTSFYVTDVESLIKNPYSIYIKSILRLRPLRDIDDDNYHLEVGNLLHKIFEIYAHLMKQNNGINDEILLLQARDSVFSDYKENKHSAFWSLFEFRLNTLLPSFLQLDRQWRLDTVPYLLETRAECKITTKHNEIELKAKADRIDIWGQYGIAIIDYKSGKAPSSVEIVSGKKPQLPLEMMMATAGAFGKPVEINHIKAEFWHVKDGHSFESQNLNDIKIRGENNITAPELIQHTIEQFSELMDLMLNPSTPFHVIPPSGWTMMETDEKIHHLARTDEWAFLYDGADDNGDES
jgi:ATP-dependent helicase/nuclease subunit B